MRTSALPQPVPHEKQNTRKGQKCPQGAKGEEKRQSVLMVRKQGSPLGFPSPSSGWQGQSNKPQDYIPVPFGMVTGLLFMFNCTRNGKAGLYSAEVKGCLSNTVTLTSRQLSGDERQESRQHTRVRPSCVFSQVSRGICFS